MTQLIGRILRQPYALKTGNPALDECYVVTVHAATKDIVRAIKNGLEKDGLADFVIEVPNGGVAPNPGTVRNEFSAKLSRVARLFSRESLFRRKRRVHECVIDLSVSTGIMH
jgi:hypothetical protein